MHSFIHSRLDYCNSLFYGISDKELSLLQSVQNRAAKVVVGGLKFDHVTQTLAELHWLPVGKRIVFKIGVLMYKCLNGMAPQYLMNNCVFKNTLFQTHDLRSNDANFLMVPLNRLKIGSRNFSIFGPNIWNSFPCHLRHPGLTLLSFKKELKTYLFTL